MFFIAFHALLLNSSYGLNVDESVTIQQDDQPPFTLGEATFLGSGCPENSVMSILSPGNEQLSIIFSDYIATTEGSTLNVEKSCDLAIPVEVSPNVMLAIFKVEYRGFTFISEVDAKRRLMLRPQTPSTETRRSLKKKKKNKGKKKKTKGKNKKKKKTKKPTSRPVSDPTSPPVSDPTSPPVSDPTSKPVSEPVSERFSQFRAEYFFAGNKGPTLDKKFTETEDSFFIDDELNVVVFSECGASTTLRIATSIVANKGANNEPDIEIGLDSTEVTSPTDDAATIKYFVRATDC